MPTPATTQIFVAVDTTDLATAAAQTAATAGVIPGIKLGLEFFTAHGPDGVRAVRSGSRPLFLDLKLHDIPNTVAGAARAVTPLRPTLLTVHAGGGAAMLRAALDGAGEASAKAGITRPSIIGVTVLTSLAESDIDAVGQRGPIADQARRLAALAKSCELDGVVCSPHEIAALRAECGAGFLLVVPGIRPAWTAAGDQKRVMTPAGARLGADFLIVGHHARRGSRRQAAADRGRSRRGGPGGQAARIGPCPCARSLRRQQPRRFRPARHRGGAGFVGFISIRQPARADRGWAWPRSPPIRPPVIARSASWSTTPTSASPRSWRVVRWTRCSCTARTPGARRRHPAASASR
jgi:orotidine-5'-phosphate decarboxylase